MTYSRKTRRAKSSTRKVGGYKRKKSSGWKKPSGTKASRKESSSKKSGKSAKAAKFSKKDRAWPRKGTKAMRRVVAGVEAVGQEDLLKALRLIQKVKAKERNTAKRAGVKSSSEKQLNSIARKLEWVLQKAGIL